MSKLRSLDILIQIRERELDMLRRRMAVLEGQKEQFQGEIRRLARELEAEEAAAKSQLDMLPFLQSYARKNAEEAKQYEQAIARLDGQIRELNEIIQKIFGELKKVEIAKEQLLAEMAEEERREENKQMDEIAQQNFERRETL